MEGSRRGRPRGSSTAARGRGAKIPSPQPPTLAHHMASQPLQQAQYRPPSGASMATGPFGAGVGGGGLSGPSFTNGIRSVYLQVLNRTYCPIDILNHLPPPKRQEMLLLVARFRSKELLIQEFLAISRTLLGEQLYAVLLDCPSLPPSVPVYVSSWERALMFGVAMPSMNPSNDDSGAIVSSGMGEDGESNALSGGGFDVNKLDSAALQDVIQYSGVDLKAEAEMIMRHDHFGSNVPIGKDPRIHYEYYLNGPRLRTLISAAVMPRGIVDMSEDCLDMLALAVRRRLANVVAELVEISKHRIDMGRANYKIKIENDPKKQLWLVEQYLAAENERVKRGQGSFGSADALAMARAKMKKAEKRASEDVVVKTKLANVTAAVATGLQQKSWMMDAAALAPLPDTPSVGPSPNASSVTPPDGTKIPLHFSQAPSSTPISDRDLQAQFTSRTISLRDLVYFSENDQHLRQSTFLLSLYSQLGV